MYLQIYMLPCMAINMSLRYCIQGLQIYEESGYGLDLDLLTILISTWEKIAPPYTSPALAQNLFK
jgi:hypothetical protein